MSSSLPWRNMFNKLFLSKRIRKWASKDSRWWIDLFFVVIWPPQKPKAFEDSGIPWKLLTSIDSFDNTAPEVNEQRGAGLRSVCVCVYVWWWLWWHVGGRGSRRRRAKLSRPWCCCCVWLDGTDSISWPFCLGRSKTKKKRLSRRIWPPSYQSLEQKLYCPKRLEAWSYGSTANGVANIQDQIRSWIL